VVRVKQWVWQQSLFFYHFENLRTSTDESSHAEDGGGVWIERDRITGWWQGNAW
jgi:hypothetical protein